MAASFNLRSILRKRTPLNDEGETQDLPLLDHLEALRWHLLRSAIAVVVLSIFAFANKEFLFDTLLFGPSKPGFVTYRVLCDMAAQVTFLSGLCMPNVGFKIANMSMTGQFFTHMSTSLYAGIAMAFPYIIYEVWRFVMPGLHPNERKGAVGLVMGVTFLFAVGILFGYYVLAPFSIVFLGNYQVSAEVNNFIALESYLGTVTTLTFACGVIFQLPILMYFLARFGVITAPFLRKYRRHAYLILVLLAAVITPGGDIGTLLMMSVPLIILYEISFLLVVGQSRRRARMAAAEASGTVTITTTVVK